MRFKQYPILFLLFHIILITMPLSNNASSFTPKWMKVGAFAEYTFNSNAIFFVNGTLINFNDTIPMILRWECVGLNETIAELEVSIDFTEENNQFLISEKIRVNIFDRGVFLQNGTLIGTSLFWTQSNPALGQEIILWDVPPDKITAIVSAISQDRQFAITTTPQGKQKAFYIASSGSINGMFRYISLVCDVDTGITTDGLLEWDPSFKVLGIYSPGRIGSLDFTDTNIDLGPSENSFELGSFLPISALVVASLIIFVMIYRNRRKH